MTDIPTHREATIIESGEGYANLTDDSSFKGKIFVYPNWVTIKNENGKYTVPRRRIDHVNWKKVNQ